MSESKNNSVDFLRKACVFEASLIVLALILGWLTGVNPFEKLYFSEIAVAHGIIGTAPLLLMFGVMERIDKEPIKKIRQLLLNTLGPVLYQKHWTDLLVLCAVVGASEEILFRGFLQPWMGLMWGGGAGLIVSNMIFGLVHAVTPLYAVLAALIGLYLGLSLDFGGCRNLLIPIVIHGLYDYFAFIMLLRQYRSTQSTET